MVLTDYKMRELQRLKLPSVNYEQLQHMAFNADYHSVYSLITKLNASERREIDDKYILFETITGSINKINDLIRLHNEPFLNAEKKFLLEITNQFITVCKQSSIFPRQFFQSILKVCRVLFQLSEYELTKDYLNKALDCGSNKYPDIKTEILLLLADVYNKQGQIDISGNYIIRLLSHPYFITDRNKIGELINNVSQIYLKQGNIEKYKDLLFQGLRHFYTNPEERRKIYDQIRQTYRTSLKVLVCNDKSFAYRLLYFIHWIYYKLPNFSKLKLSFINKLSQRSLLVVIYILNYTFLKEASKFIFKEQRQSSNNLQFYVRDKAEITSNKRSAIKKKILITRAMGGIGDLLMMTPGIYALKKKYPKSEIELAIPKRYFPIFENNKDVKLLDIEEDYFNHLEYDKWFNFTDCPAARIESLTSPRVRKSRIEIFSSALKINLVSRWHMSKIPRFFFSEDELNFANEHWEELGLENKKVIGVQLHSDETYRDYPLMENLVEQLSKNYVVMLFDGNVIKGFEFENVIKVQNLSIRKAFSLAYKCDLIIAPDSSFVHFAAAFDIPTIALFGPIDGKIRTKHYSNCTYLSAKDIFGCLPCWRNEDIPCKLTGMRTSECMKAIPVSKIIKTLELKLNGVNINA